LDILVLNHTRTPEAWGRAQKGVCGALEPWANTVRRRRSSSVRMAHEPVRVSSHVSCSKKENEPCRGDGRAVVAIAISNVLTSLIQPRRKGDRASPGRE